MAHNLFSERFYQNRTQPAWHGLGLNSEEPLTASEALERLGSYTVTLQPIEIPLPDGLTLNSEYSAIVRQPTNDDPIHRVFGSPVHHYELVTPQMACQLWDENVKDAQNKTVPVETFGVLGMGERLFITVKLPQFDVRGDAINMYMVYDNPMYSGRSAGVYTTGVRVVCQNTLTLGIHSATQRKAISHLPGTSRELKRWLHEIYGNAISTAKLAQEAFEKLANTPARLPEITWIAEKVYPMPDQPKFESISRTDYETREANWQYASNFIKRIRSKVINLFDGDGVGMSHESCNGTLFGAYNAVAEFETYRQSRGDSYAVDLVGGTRAARIRRAYNAAFELMPVKA